MTFSFTLAFGATESSGKEIPANEAIRTLLKSDVDSRLEKYGVRPLDYRGTVINIFVVLHSFLLLMLSFVKGLRHVFNVTVFVAFT